MRSKAASVSVPFHSVCAGSVAIPMYVRVEYTDVATDDAIEQTLETVILAATNEIRL